MAEKTQTTNREYRSDVFSMLMEVPEYALQVYNALNGTAYDNAEQLEMKRLDRGIYLSIRNDASFVLDSYLNLYEHQSTVCPNMPIRNLIYVANLWEEMVKHHDLFGSRQVKVPAPKFVVFYNGRRPQPEEQILKLSDAYEKKEEPVQLELLCKVVNINYGHSEQFLHQCRILYEYSYFVNEVHVQEKETAKQTGDREGYLQENIFIGVLEKAIDNCIENHILEDFLKKNRSEVLRMTTLDYSFERRLELQKEEGRSEGHEEGMAAGREEGMAAGADLLGKAIKELRAGLSEVQLLSEGIPQNILNQAKDLLKMM